MKEKLGKFVFQMVASIVIVILAGSIWRSVHDLFLFGYNLGH